MGSCKCRVGRASRSPSSATDRTKDRPLAAKHTTDGAPAPDDAATDSNARADRDRAVRPVRYQAVERAFAAAAAQQRSADPPPGPPEKRVCRELLSSLADQAHR